MHIQFAHYILWPFNPMLLKDVYISGEGPIISVMCKTWRKAQSTGIKKDFGKY